MSITTEAPHSLRWRTAVDNPLGSTRGVSPSADDHTPLALWTHRPVPETMSPVKLAALIEQETERAAERLMTVTPAQELDGIGRSQQLLDQAFAHQCRMIVEAHSRTARDDREFVIDHVALALTLSPRTARKLVEVALGLAALPGMLEAISAGMLSQRHALAVLNQLDDTPDLSVEHRIAIATIVLMRLDGTQTPGDLARLTEKLILTIDLPAAEKRREAATARRNVRTYATSNGQGVFVATGPLEKIALMRTALQAWWQDNPRQPDDTRTDAEREFDLVLALITGGEKATTHVSHMIVPFSTAAGHDLELAEIPGLGPVLPSVARQHLEDSQVWSQIAVDDNGSVAVTDPAPLPEAEDQAEAGQGTEGTEGTEGPDGPDEPRGGGGPLLPQGPIGPGPAGPPTWDEPPFGQIDYPSWLDDLPDAYRIGPPETIPQPRQPMSEQWWQALTALAGTPPPERLRPEKLTSSAYAAPPRLKRYLRARDQHCVFPGCRNRVIDVDHRIPYPAGATSAHNTQQLCRRHHRAKQAVFTVELLPDGDYLWTTKSGWQFIRKRIAY